MLLREGQGPMEESLVHTGRGGFARVLHMGEGEIKTTQGGCRVRPIAHLSKAIEVP